MQISKNKKYQYSFFFILIIYTIFNGGNSNILIQINFILVSILFLFCLKDKNYNLHLINFIKYNKKSILIPPMFLNSWLCLSKEAIYAYKWSFKGKYIDSKDQISIKWNDSRIKFNWPVKKPILSSRDR